MFIFVMNAVRARGRVRADLDKIVRMKARNLPPFHALLAFEAVARQRSFTKAADELCITHSAVSHRIRLLEEHYGVKLLVRNNQNVSVTQPGAELLKSVIESLDLLHKVSAQLQQPARSVVRVGLGHAFARSWFMEKLAGFYQLHPEIELEINAVANIECLNMLRSGVVDVAVTYTREVETEHFQSVEIIRTHSFPVCSPAYLAASGRPREPRDLLAAQLLRVPMQPWSPWFRAAGVAVTDDAIRGPLFNDMDLMLNAAVGGYGIGLARDVLADYDLSTGRLVRLFDLSISSDWCYRALFAPGARSAPQVDSFLHWLVSVADRSRPAQPQN